MGSISLCESLQTESILQLEAWEKQQGKAEIQSMRRTQPTVADFEDERGHRSGNGSSLLNPSIPQSTVSKEMETQSLQLHGIESSTNLNAPESDFFLWASS